MDIINMQEIDSNEITAADIQNPCDTELYNEKIRYETECILLDEKIDEYKNNPNFQKNININNSLLQIESELRKQEKTRFAYYDCSTCGGTGRQVVTRQCDCQGGFKIMHGVYPISSYRTPCGNCRSGFYTVDKGKCNDCVNGYQRFESELFIKAVNEYNRKIDLYKKEIQFYDEFNILLDNKQKLKNIHEKNNSKIFEKYSSGQSKSKSKFKSKAKNQSQNAKRLNSVNRNTINSKQNRSRNKPIDETKSKTSELANPAQPVHTDLSTCVDVVQEVVGLVGLVAQLGVALALFVPRRIVASCCSR